MAKIVAWFDYEGYYIKESGMDENETREFLEGLTPEELEFGKKLHIYRQFGTVSR